MLMAQMRRAADAFNLDPQPEEQALLAGVLADGSDIVRQPGPRIPIAHIPSPAVRFRSEPASVNHKHLRSGVGRQVNFLIDARLAFVIDDVTTMIGFHQHVTAGHGWWQNLAPDMLVQGLDDAVQIPTHAEDVRVRSLHTIARREDPERGVHGAWPHAEEKRGTVGLGTLLPAHLIRPVAAPTE